MNWEDEVAKFNYNMYSRELVKTLKKLRRSWKYKDYVLMGNILTNMETFKEQKCYDDPFTKYGIKKVVETYWKKYKKLDPLLRLTDKMQTEILMYSKSLLDEMYDKQNIEVSSTGSIPNLNVKFTLDNLDEDNSEDESKRADYDEAEFKRKILEAIHKWRIYTGDNTPFNIKESKGDEI